MTEDQLKALAGQQKIDLPFTLHVSQFSEDYSDRTLLYGYDCDRVTWHLYVDDGDIYLHCYTPDGTTFRHNLSRDPFKRSTLQATIVPNKRLYPERCDYDFCVWAKQEGLHLTFTTYDAERVKPVDGYFGKI